VAPFHAGLESIEGPGHLLFGHPERPGEIGGHLLPAIGLSGPLVAQLVERALELVLVDTEPVGEPSETKRPLVVVSTVGVGAS